MKDIYVNARFLTQEITGVQRFAIEICKSIKNNTSFSSVVFLSPPNIIHHDIAKLLDVKVVGKNTGHMWEQVDLVLFLRSNGTPLLLNLANSAPLLYFNKAITIHDLAIYHNPRWFSFFYRSYYKFITPIIIRNSNVIFTVSNSVKSEILEKFESAKGKTFVIYNGVSEKFIEANKNKQKENLILTVGSIDERKNIKNLLLAFMQVHLKDYRLYVIGGANLSFVKMNIGKIAEMDGRIKILGRVSDEELIDLYCRAKLFVYPSFYEGFGIPNIEAMSMGTPVLTSNIPAIKEVCGGAAYYVDPTKISEIVEAFSTLLNNDKLLNDLSLKGLKRSKKYRWSRSADILLKILNSDG